MREVADESQNDGAEAIGGDRRHAEPFNQQQQSAGTGKHHATIDNVATEILAQDVALGSEDNELVADKGIGDGHDVGWNGQHQIVDAAPQPIIESAIYSHAKDGVPAANQEVANELPLWCGKQVRTARTEFAHGFNHWQNRMTESWRIIR